MQDRSEVEALCSELGLAADSIDYDAYESGVHRARVKSADFVGKDAYQAQRREEPAALLCSMTLDSLSVADGPKRYPVGIWPILDANSKDALIDERGRRSYATSTSYCPSLGVHAVMGYLPRERAQAGNALVLEYFDEGGDGHYPMTVRVVGAGSLYDPDNLRVRG